MADLLADVRRVRLVGDMFGPGSTAVSMWKVAERALEHDDPEVRAVAGQLLAELERSSALPSLDGSERRRAGRHPRRAV